MVTEVSTLATGVTLISIGCVEPSVITARAGQFVSLRLPDSGRRSYSIVSGSGERSEFEVVVKVASSDGGTAEFVAALVPGSEVFYFGPMGYFLCEPREQADVTLGATGIGISALLPMINEALSSGASSVRLFWGLRNRTDQIFADRLDEHAKDARFEARLFFSGDGEGYITDPMVEWVRNSNAPEVYLCGHGQMIADVRVALGRGFEPSRLHTEVFYPAVPAH